MTFPSVRPRRLRMRDALRRAVAETRLHPSQLVLPVFVVDGEVRNDRVDARALPAVGGPGDLARQRSRVRRCRRDAVFGVPAHKDETGSSAWDPAGPVPRAIAAVADAAPELVRWADVCLCEYTSHGHCGPVRGGVVDNDASLPLLARAAVTYAEAGAEVVAPSDMMDGRVAAIRAELDRAGFHDAVICSYAVKYASAYYGPFRDAAGSAPAFGDRRTHQMDPPNVREALREALLDVEEGADMVMVKPAGPYLDVVRAVAEVSPVPVAAYQVSGELALIEAAGERGWVDRDRVVMESLVGIARAGADVVLTYFALDAARLLEGSR